MLPLLQSAQPPIETVLAAVLNELAAAPNDVDLVLDDYHLVDGPDLRDGMAFLLEHLPPHVHLVISSRADPLLPLARLRARGELVEVRAADLRFTPDEVAAYLNDVTGLDLTPGRHRRVGGPDRRLDRRAPARRPVDAGTRRTSAGSSPDSPGDDRYIVDYLVEEVLARQTEQVRTFLLRTCAAGPAQRPAVRCRDRPRPAARPLLEAAGPRQPVPGPARRQPPLVPLPPPVRGHAAGPPHDERPDEVTDLHRRASQWYDAERRAVTGDPPRARRRGHRAGSGPGRAGHPRAAAEQAGGHHPRLARRHPRRGRADAAGARDRPHRGVDGRRRVRGRRGTASGCRAVAGAALPGRWIGRAGRGNGRRRRGGASAPARGDRDVPGRAGVGRRRPGRHPAARPAGDRPRRRRGHVTRAGASALSGLASWATGDLEAAHRAYSTCVEGLQRAGHLSDVLGCSITLADIRTTQGRLGDALRTFERALQLAAQEAGTSAPGTPRTCTWA